MTYSAYISDCGLFRYLLNFKLANSGLRACVVMVNPSTADGILKDATIRKLDGFGKRLGWGSYSVVNKFAYRATDVNALKTAVDPIGPINDAAILLAMADADIVVAAWGSLAKLPPQLRSRWRVIVDTARAAGKPLYCWGVCADGSPLHPVMISYNLELREWKSYR